MLQTAPNLAPKLEAFTAGSSVSSDYHQESMRSSVSPNNEEDLMEDDVSPKIEDVEEMEHSGISKRVSKLENDFVYIKHQLASIMTHLHAEPCKCTTCKKVSQEGVEKKQNDATNMLSELFPNATVQQIKTLLDLSKMNKLPSQVVHQKENGTPAPTAPQPQQSKPTVTPKPEVLKLGQGYQNGNQAGGKIIAERYSEPVRKIKKFGALPPVVSAYYQRKDSSNSLIPAATTNSSTASPGPSSSDGDEGPLDMQVQQSSTVPATPTTPGANLFTQSMVDMLKLNNAAHSTGSPGFLRGRGRGRPKLIGDELDADLVDYMVSLKNADPHKGNFTASQALHMARQYILERAPGLLEEHGGHVKLKLTWAMKLVSRIGERQREIELGLPAGSLSNMGRNLTNLNPPGGNFMADMMAQNMLSQHIMMVNQQLGGSGGSPPNGKQDQNEENINVKKEASTMPEIVNIKELSIPFLNNFLAELNDKNLGLVDGEIGGAGSSALFAPNA